MMQQVTVYVICSHKSTREIDGAYYGRIEYVRSNGEMESVDETAIEKSITGNALGIVGMAATLDHLIRPCELTIYTDCRYLYGAIRNGWIKAWENNGWKTAKGETVKHTALWTSLWEQLKTHEVKEILDIRMDAYGKTKLKEMLEHTKEQEERKEWKNYRAKYLRP